MRSRLDRRRSSSECFTWNIPQIVKNRCRRTYRHRLCCVLVNERLNTFSICSHRRTYRFNNASTLHPVFYTAINKEKNTNDQLFNDYW